MDVSDPRSVANAILYEGYMLYPYRPSALKNRSQGWTFGTLLPQLYASSHPGEPSFFQAEALITGSGPRISAEIRFLHLNGSAALERVLSIDETRVTNLADAPVTQTLELPANAEQRCHPLKATAEISATRLSESIHKVTLTLRNQSQPALAWECRDNALQQALVSAHALLFAADGDFVSLLNPPEQYRQASASCQQSGVFPVLAGEEGRHDAMLVSPIILYDYPRIASNSHGDFFDSSEIDEMLTLRLMTLSEAEKEEIRTTNDQAHALLQRTESLQPEQILNLHGVIHEITRSEH